MCLSWKSKVLDSFSSKVNKQEECCRQRCVRAGSCSQSSQTLHHQPSPVTGEGGRVTAETRAVRGVWSLTLIKHRKMPE